jgi:hypothetical protein
MSVSSRHRYLAILTAALTGAAVAVMPASPALAATWTVVPTPDAGVGDNHLVGVEALAANDAWAVGRASHSTQPFVRPLALRWNGTAWSVAGTPVLGGRFDAVDGSAATSVWAVGARDVDLGGGTVTTHTLTERWNGTAWSVVSSPVPPGAIGSSLSGVKAFTTSTDAWAVGTYTGPFTPSSRTLIQRWNGTSWSIVASPNPDPNRNLLVDVDGVATGDVWAIGNLGDDGYGGTNRGVVLRWNGTAWSQATVPGTDSDGTFQLPRLDHITVASVNDVWILGQAFHLPTFTTVPFSLHWNGSTWQRAIVNGGGSGGPAVLGTTRTYAVGGGIARWNGTSWVAESVALPGTLSDATATGASTVWAVGSRYDATPGRSRTLAVRTTNG